MSETASSLIFKALDPSRSVVVEACAGSGKTWLLASRIVRLLFSGVAPGEILAITFTRKAAREIEERVIDWLKMLAKASDTQISSFLVERGVPVDEAGLRVARGLYERVLEAQPRLAVNTFHGWFLQLVDAAPLSANLAGMTLVDSGARFFDELWQSFAAVLQKKKENDTTQAFVRLLEDAGQDSARRLIRRAFERRSEWQVLDADPVQIAGKVIASLREHMAAGEPGEALKDFFSGNWFLDFQAYLGLLEMSELVSDKAYVQLLHAALVETDTVRCFEGLRVVMLTKDNLMRQRKPGPAANKRFGIEGAVRFFALHEQLSSCLVSCLERQTAERILAFNCDASTVFSAFLAHVDSFKQARRQIDFVDAEWKVLQLLRNEDTAAFLQARLDARYRHVLLDEFQDTNPLQWQILRAWFDAYSDAVRPGMFLVGDPKQSIYRFRRAEPRLFAVAAAFLQREYGAVCCEQDVTRRNAQPVIDVVNALFLGVPEFAPFREQSSLTGKLPGKVELLPLFGKDETGAVITSEGLRDPLMEPDAEPEDLRRRKEAEALAERIGEIVGHKGSAWQIQDRDADGEPFLRPAGYADILLLVRTRTALSVYERALSAANIPFDAASRGGLLASLEVQDIVALLEFLSMPLDDLKLAQTLRSPVFACDENELMQLALREESSWWQRLNALLQAGTTPRLARAARLLEKWLQAAGQLPVHDLLDRVFHEGEVLARYRMAVPETIGASVEANLRALLLLTLDLDGGRYPSLPRFVDELRELRQAEASDSPDEGEIEAQHVDSGRVRMLTIHGAKGLEAPIVWLLGANAAPRAPDPWDVLVDWQPEDFAPRHYSFVGRKEDRGVARQPLFDAERQAARREELNLLYVAITRARQVFIASGIENAKEQESTPYRMLETALRTLGGEGVHGEALPVARVSVREKRISRIADFQPWPSVGERRQPAGGAERFGILLHALLERRTGNAESDSWWKSLGFDEREYRRVLPVAEKLLGTPELQRFFDPGKHCRAWNEVDLTGGDGILRRIDRLVEFNDETWVLDYKSSGSDTLRLNEYRDQVDAYCRIVACAFPGRKVIGGLIFADGVLIEIHPDQGLVL